MTRKKVDNLPSGGRLDVATTTTPEENRRVNSRLRIMASAMSVTCQRQEKKSGLDFGAQYLLYEQRKVLFGKWRTTVFTSSKIITTAECRVGEVLLPETRRSIVGDLIGKVLQRPLQLDHKRNPSGNLLLLGNFAWINEFLKREVEDS